MRYFAILLVIAFLAITTPVRADDTDAVAQKSAALDKQISDLVTRLDKVWDSPEGDQLEKQIDQLQAQQTELMNQRVKNSNDSVRQLTKDRDPLAAQTDFMNNVISLRKKDDLDKWADEMRKKWDADTGQRIGIINPYDGSSFYRYYDKDGNLVVTKVKGDYDLLKQKDDAWDQSFKRAKWALESVQGDYQKMEDQYGKVMALKAKIAAQSTPSRPMDTNPPEEGVTVKDGIRYKNFNGVPYPIAPDQEKIPNYKGPRWVNGRLVSP